MTLAQQILIKDRIEAIMQEIREEGSLPPEILCPLQDFIEKFDCFQFDSIGELPPGYWSKFSTAVTRIG